MEDKIKVAGTAVVILNWNGKHYLEMFLPKLLRSVEWMNATGGEHYGHSEVIVADNASTDGSMEMMAEKFPHTKTIVFDKNYGFTGGYNRAYERIDCKYFLLINSDIEVPEQWLGPLAECMEADPSCGICAPKLHSWQDKEMFEYAGAAGGYIDRFGYPFCRGRVMKKLEKDAGQYDSPANVFWATGACLMIRSSVWKELGGLDERFFAHMEEIDMCWRAQLAGWKVRIVPSSTVYHIGGGTLPQNSPWKLYLNFRNNLLMLDNNLAKTYALDMSPEKAVRKARRTIFVRMLMDGGAAGVYLLTFRFRYFKAVVKAHKDFRILRKRQGPEAVSGYIRRIQEEGKAPAVTGLYNGWMIPMAVFGIRIKF